MAPLLSSRHMMQHSLQSQQQQGFKGATCLPAGGPVHRRIASMQTAPVLGKSRARCAIRPQAAYSGSSSSSAARVGARSSSWAAGAAPASRLLRSQAPPARGPYIHGAVMRRGNRIIISAVLAGVEGATDVRSLLQEDLTRDERLVTGQLDNGLRYVIYPNKLPPKRFEAHLEMHVGSVDELPNEQGIAHLVEHVTFLGSNKREQLLGTGARANAYTDFHHTVFHVHAPVLSQTTSAPMLPQVLEALKEIAFLPQFSPLRIEKERKAVLAEAQMMNTIEYRVDCQLLQHLHFENNLGCRFPIGKMEQVQNWDHAQLRDFWGKWYFPANSTLYIVGDLDRDVEATTSLIQQVFGNVKAGTTTLEQVEHLAHLSKEAADGHQPPSYMVLPAPPEPSTNGNSNSHTSTDSSTDNGDKSPSVMLVKQRHPIRPPVQHVWGFGPLEPDFKPARVNVFRHPLLQHYMLSVFSKLPIMPMTRMEHLKRMFLMRILVSTFQFRVNKRYVQADPPFLGISLDISDSGREGCVVCTLTVTSQPGDWQGATQVAVQEMRRMQRHGLTQGELDRYKAALIRDSSQLAEQGDRIPSVDTLNFVMESLACGHSVMKHKQAHDVMVAVADTTTLDDVNALARSILTFGSDYGHEAEALARADETPSDYTFLGPTRTTSMLVCIPAYISDTGDALTPGGAAAAARASANLGAAGHIDVDQVDLQAIEEQSKAAAAAEEIVPDGAVRFDVAPEEVQRVMADMSYEVEAPVDVQCPVHLVDMDSIEHRLSTMRPHFVALDGSQDGDPYPAPDPHSGVIQRRLSNGVRINYRHTDNEPRGGLLRVITPGGRAAEKMEAGPDGFGAVWMGPATLNESGRCGKWKREEVEVFSIANLVNMILDCDEENILFDMHFAAGEQTTLEAAFEAMHMTLVEPAWTEEAFKRAKLQCVNQRVGTEKSLEKGTEEKVMSTMMGGPETRRFRPPTDEELEALTLDGVRSTFEGLMHPGSMEVNIVGDVDFEVLEGLILKYLGTIPPRDPSKIIPAQHITQSWQNPSFEDRHFSWHLRDSDQRGVAYIAGPAPARWGPFGSFDPLPPLPDVIVPPPAPPATTYPKASARQQAAEIRRAHPLYSSCLLMLLTEIINSRLFTTVRDSLGLTYDVSFSCTMFDRIRAGWFSVYVTSDPSKIYDALDASVAVLRDIASSPINRRELARARTTILTRHESDLKDNAYWLGLMTHTQNPAVPWKDITCLRDLILVYESITIEDIYNAYSQFKLDDNALFTCVGTSGKEAPQPPESRLVNGIGSTRYAESDWASQQAANGQAPTLNPMAMFTAMLAAAQAMNLRKAVDIAGQEGANKANTPQ